MECTGFTNPFTYDTMNTQSSGLNIDTSTDPLSNPYELGINYGNPYLRYLNCHYTP